MDDTPPGRFFAALGFVTYGRQGPPRLVEPPLPREASRWSVHHRVTRTASVSLAGNRYKVDIGTQV